MQSSYRNSNCDRSSAASEEDECCDEAARVSHHFELSHWADQESSPKIENRNKTTKPEPKPKPKPK
jgi:hypothetical protein